MNWQDRAKNLRIGQRTKIPHCGTDSTAYISNSLKGVSLFCFRCKESLYEPHGRLSAKDLIAMRAEETEARKWGLPKGSPLYADSVPPEARVWCLKAGITPERMSDTYGAVYSKKILRVAVPMMLNGVLQEGWVARAIDGRKPKYIAPIGTSNSSWMRTDLKGKPLVVVEDVLSAIRISEAGFNAVSVMGTAVTQSVANEIAVAGDAGVIGWFDNDAGGRDGFVSLRRSMAPYGISPDRIRSDMDPKRYTQAEIMEYVNG